MPRLISFICNACGMLGDRSPYVCPQCDFMIHKDCIYLPRVIHVNLHHHRVSRTYFLGLGNLICGVCRREIDVKYGAYSCSICPQYAVHSKCATRKDVWDGKELEDEPEEDEEDVEPFKVVGDNIINHFSHEEHNLRFEKSGHSDKTVFCCACILPIYLDSCYICLDCEFILHETCANLPRKKRHVLHNHPLTLETKIQFDVFSEGVFKCSACGEFSVGFGYKCCNLRLDARCGAITEPFVHKGHPHPLFYTSPNPMFCQACGRFKTFVLSCIDCNFVLCFVCATLPCMVKRPIYDRHPLTVCFGEKASGKYWCETCEAKVDHEACFYSCEECVTTLHIDCVQLTSFIYVKPGYTFTFMDHGFEMVLGNGLSRPKCRVCRRECAGSFVKCNAENKYFHSAFCLYIHFSGDLRAFYRQVILEKKKCE